MINKPKALITGITGQDGSYLTKLLLTKGYQVYGLITGQVGRDNFDNFPKLELDVNSIVKVKFTELKDLLDDDFEIYNLAAQSSVGLSWQQPELTFSVNLQNYLRILEVCKDKKVRILQASSAEIYGDKGNISLQENSDFEPNNPYALSKYSAHRYGQILRTSLNYFITNAILFSHESKLRDEKFVLKKIANYAKRGDFTQKLELGNLEIERDWGLAEEYVETMWKLLQLDKPQDINVATGKTTKLKELIKAIFAYYNITNYEKHITINPKFIRPSDIQSLVADMSKLGALNIKLTPLIDSLSKILID